MSGAAPSSEAIRFLADGEVPRDLAASVVARVSRHVAVACHLSPHPWDADVVHLVGRDQVDADALLAGLDAFATPGIVHVGLTGLDLGLPLFTFVFGRARRGGFAAVVSLARLAHCDDFACIMHFAPNVETIDLSGTEFCSTCVAVLPPYLLPAGVRPHL